MTTMTQNATFVEYYAQCQTPAGALLYGTAHNTPFGWLFIDQDGLDPFYTDKRALVLCGQVAITQEQERRDLATAWTNHMLKGKCRVAA